VHAHLDGAPGPDDRPSLVVAFSTTTAVPSRRRTGPRGGRHPGWFLPPTGCLDTPPDEERGYVAAHDLDLVPEERDGTGGIAPAAPR
jgi:hypothetical protein